MSTHIRADSKLAVINLYLVFFTTKKKKNLSAFFPADICIDTYEKQCVTRKSNMPLTHWGQDRDVGWIYLQYFPRICGCNMRPDSLLTMNSQSPERDALSRRQNWRSSHTCVMLIVPTEANWNPPAAADSMFDWWKNSHRTTDVFLFCSVSQVCCCVGTVSGFLCTWQTGRYVCVCVCMCACACLYMCMCVRRSTTADRSSPTAIRLFNSSTCPNNHLPLTLLFVFFCVNILLLLFTFMRICLTLFFPLYVFHARAVVTSEFPPVVG